MWYRVFGASAVEPQPAALLEHLNQQGRRVAGHFRGDDQGWFQADLVPEGASLLRLERFLTEEEGIRSELNSWAAWLEGADAVDLMGRMIGTAQLFTLHPAEADAEPGTFEQLCVAICRYLAETTGGLYQVDQQGFFDADGTLLVPEE